MPGVDLWTSKSWAISLMMNSADDDDDDDDDDSANDDADRKSKRETGLTLVPESWALNVHIYCTMPCTNSYLGD